MKLLSLPAALLLASSCTSPQSTGDGLTTSGGKFIPNLSSAAIAPHEAYSWRMGIEGEIRGELFHDFDGSRLFIDWRFPVIGYTNSVGGNYFTSLQDIPLAIGPLR
jgi:hypothetical protein